ncbi:hypothetical protein, partial [Pseudomonas sp. N8]|uniref:hypothetical protein n=1 Tax=Pseudomonas sp. N8 TaxID=3449428 RepID=UPI003F69CCAE
MTDPISKTAAMIKLYGRWGDCQGIQLKGAGFECFVVKGFILWRGDLSPIGLRSSPSIRQRGVSDRPRWLKEGPLRSP